MSIVLGMGFGDEGKGLTTSFLCDQVKRPLVVRFSGGHQAGHTVVTNGIRHVFSSFGSGTLQGVPTYWSRYCTFYPKAFLNEYKALGKKGVEPYFCVNPLAPMTTPYDVEFNRRAEEKLRHGSVGAGFGATIQRQEAYYKLFVQDLMFKDIMFQKLKNIAKYYSGIQVDLDLFMSEAEEAYKLINICPDEILKTYDPIFEGSQGIMLDQDFGFFPNVTRSNTTSRNALELHPWLRQSAVYYVTRSYQTRHGNGYMTNEKKLALKNNKLETNKSNKYQGHFRTGNLDVNLLKYAIQCDDNFSRGMAKNLVVTCLDQLEIDVDRLVDDLDCSFENVYISRGPETKDLVYYKKGGEPG